MTIIDFMEKNEIAIFAKADLKNKRFEIVKNDVELESYDLFEQLVLFGKVENLEASIEGQIMPRMWAQGNTKCAICKPNDEILIALFYDSSMDAKDNYYHTKELDKQLKEMRNLIIL